MIPCTQKRTFFDKLVAFFVDLSWGPSLFARIPTRYWNSPAPVGLFFRFLRARMPRGSIFGSPWCPACSRIRSQIIQAGCIFCGSRLGPSVFCADACRVLNLFNVRDDIFRFFRPGVPRSKNLAALATQLASKWHPKSALVTQLALKWHPKSSKRRHLLNIFGTMAVSPLSWSPLWIRTPTEPY